MDDEQGINICKTGIGLIYSMLRAPSQSPHRIYFNLAQAIIIHLVSIRFMERRSRTAEQSWIIAALQRLASMDDANPHTREISSWCFRRWMDIHEQDPQNVAALRGLGESWLARAQPALARIHRQDGSTSSSGGGSQISVKSITASEEERQSAAAMVEAEHRSNTQDYIEARGYLQPATDYLDRATAAATEQGILSGDLLATTAEAYLSLGNASTPRTNEQYFVRAVRLLQTASQIEGYTLNNYLQQYLDDYGRLLD